MGIRNSSLTRVKPLFDSIGLDENKLNEFFKLFEIEKIKIYQGDILKIKYGDNEKKLAPAKSLLIWMLQNLGKLNNIDKYGVKTINSETYKKREQLFSGNIEVQKEAIELVQQKSKIPRKAWYIFEGYTCPDIFIETKDSIFIGEAKRTEKNITAKTKWLSQRDQLIRHIDSKLDQPKTIYSFYILDKNEFSKGYYPNAMRLYENLEYFKQNLKHRDIISIERAINSFIGFIFWEDISKHLTIDFPDKIDNYRNS